MVIGSTPERPPIPALVFGNRQVVDAGDTQPHQPVFVELPIFIAVAAKPVAAVVVPFVGKAHRDAVLAKRPKLLDEPVIEFARPLAREKPLNGVASLQEFSAVAPAAIRGVRKRN